MTQSTAPLFRDPIHDGAADPTVIWNHLEKCWWILYTNRRASAPGRGVDWVHGTDIGIASSADGGRTWSYRGVVAGLPFERGLNTFWAPEVLFHAGQYHMWVSYVPGVPCDWSGPRTILHYTSTNLWDWRFERPLALSSQRVIDACVAPLPSGAWRMWYKDEEHVSHTYAADSTDLAAWVVRGPAITDCPHEGPNVFQWKGSYWMLTDTWAGLGVYRSTDAGEWVRTGTILDKPGRRADDGALGQHADVLVNAGRAFVFYFTHPGRARGDERDPRRVESFEWKRSSLQVAELHYADRVLSCDRDRELVLDLVAPEGAVGLAPSRPAPSAPSGA